MLKRIVRAALIGVAIFAGGAALVRAYMSPTWQKPLANESALAYNQTYSFQTNNARVDNLAFQCIYTSATVANQTFTDGTQSTGSITVAKLTGISTATASDFLTVLTTNSLSGKVITLNGFPLTEGVQWFNQSSTQSVAISIMKAINTYSGNVVASTSTTAGSLSVVFTTSTAPGSSGNNMTLASNTSSITVNTANFTGGQDNATVAINGVALVANSSFAVGATSAAIANAISVAANANTSISAVVTTTAPAVCGLTNPCGVVNITSIGVGTSTNYQLYSSTQATFTVSAPVATGNNGSATTNLTGGTNSAYTLNSAVITIANNPFTPLDPTQTGMIGLPVLYSTGTLAIGGLTNQTTYFVIPVDRNTFKLSLTSTGAVAGLAITITSSSTQTTAHTYTLAPLAIAGTPSFKWQMSNDGTNYNDLTATPYNVAISSVTMLSYTFGGASSIWDFGPYDYTWVRLKVIAPTQGGIQLKCTPNGEGQNANY